MVFIIFILAAVLVNATAIILLFKDCYRGWGSTMGGEMFAGLLWTAGALIWAVGVYAGSDDGVFSVAVCLAALFLWIPCRRLIVRLGLKYGKHAMNRQITERESIGPKRFRERSPSGKRLEKSGLPLPADRPRR